MLGKVVGVFQKFVFGFLITSSCEDAFDLERFSIGLLISQSEAFKIYSKPSSIIFDDSENFAKTSTSLVLSGLYDLFNQRTDDLVIHGPWSPGLVIFMIAKSSK